MNRSHKSAWLVEPRFITLESRLAPAVLTEQHGDLTGDGVADTITLANPTPDSTVVRCTDGVTGQALSGPLGELTPFPGFSGTIELAVGDVNSDSYGDLICAAGTGGGPHVKVYSGKDGSLIREFFAYEPEFTGGVYVAAADVNGDGKADILTSAGPGGGPRVRVFSGATGALLRDFFAYDSAFRGGATVTATDCNRDGLADIITGAGPGGGPQVRVFSGESNADLASFFAFDRSFQGGVYVGCADLTGEGHFDVLATPGVGGGPIANRYDAHSLTPIDSIVLGDAAARDGARTASNPTDSRDVVQQWNQVALQAIKDVGLPPPKASRLLAMVSVAQYDVVNAFSGTDQPYLANLPAPPASASAEVAASRAAYQILSNELPTYRSRLDAIWKGQEFAGKAKAGFADSVTYGTTVAQRLLADRATDGSTATVAYTPGTAPGNWQPTPPANAAALLPGWGQVKPFSLTTGSQFRPAAAPTLDSSTYATDLAEVQSLGSKTSTTRTADQTEIANFWADGGGSVTPPGHWNQIAQSLATQRNLGLLETARLFASLNAAQADAGIASWDIKYQQNLWRPVTAIRQADRDGNPATTPDTAWTPLLTTPAFPTYVSGHSTFSGAAAHVLQSFFGDTSFRSASDGVADRTRSYQSFDEAANEAGRSRIYGGIHFEFDNQAGLSTGRAIGDWVIAHDFQPITVG